MPLPELLLSNPPSLSEQLKCRTEQLCSRIVRANYSTQFARTAPELVEFRDAIAAGNVAEMDDEALSESFQKTVPFTTYDSYAPFVARFFEKPCRANAVVDLLAPGLPNFLARSSLTSGGLQKFFPRYNDMAKIRALDVESRVISDPLRRRTTAFVCWIICDRIDVADDDNGPVKTVYVGPSGVMNSRIPLCLDPEKDDKKMATFVSNHAAPYAAGFIHKWRSFLLIHGIFSLGSRSLETMSMLFINTFVDMIRHVDMEFDMVVDCIANGTIPDLEGIDNVRQYLEVNMSPDPERAEELHSLGRPSSRPWWCTCVWPRLRSVVANAGGSFAPFVPSAQWFLGPNVQIHSIRYASTEALIGSPYNPLELNQFKLGHCNSVEFLDVSKNDSAGSLVQPWEVESRRRYEVVLTTVDGLWRYRLGDVVEISGFDPTDGTPVVQLIERRNVAIRFISCVFSEEELRMAMSCLLSNTPINIVSWTTAIDDRRVPATIGFFVELVDEQVLSSDLEFATKCVFDELKRSNGAVIRAIGRDLFRQPTIRLVRPGTFSDFLQLKCDEGANNLGQLKVPVVLPKASYVTWFSNRVVCEF